ncbi:hypothetical protein AC579_9895 [Pseudocercospora musae]|uniref:Uncharacterized protein n=1 Tax=Pseudocercospora musae TaxID=113226 RepID=A0A139GYP8_9PEZI|nr:hypothetical protein AC579_9895 [Pseudocercospora musae]
MPGSKQQRRSQGWLTGSVFWPFDAFGERVLDESGLWSAAILPDLFVAAGQTKIYNMTDGCQMTQANVNTDATPCKLIDCLQGHRGPLGVAASQRDVEACVGVCLDLRYKDLVPASAALHTSDPPLPISDCGCRALPLPRSVGNHSQSKLQQAYHFVPHNMASKFVEILDIDNTPYSRSNVSLADVLAETRRRSESQDSLASVSDKSSAPSSVFNQSIQPVNAIKTRLRGFSLKKG